MKQIELSEKEKATILKSHQEAVKKETTQKETRAKGLTVPPQRKKKKN